MVRQHVLVSGVRGSGAIQFPQDPVPAQQLTAGKQQKSVRQQLPIQISDGSVPSRSKPDLREKISVRRLGQPHRHPRVKCFSWNVGGLTTERLDNLLAWFESEHILLATLQETRWTFDSEWVSGSFSIIHSGGTKQDRFCGIMVVVHSSLCPSYHIRHAIVIPGRVLHVRLAHPKCSQSIDLVNCYQHYVGTGGATESRGLQQVSLLDALWQTLSGFPRRNLLYIAGDFNMGLPSFSSMVGSSSQTLTDSMDDVQEKFLQMVVSFGLCAINSWGSPNAVTCHGPKGGGSFIDFLFLRVDHADVQSKQVKFLHTHPHANLAEAHHIPLICTWTLSWSPWRKAVPCKSPSRLTMSSATIAEQAECEWALAQALDRVGSLEALPSTVREVISRWHKAQGSVPTAPVWSDPSCQELSAKTWRIHRALAAPSGHSLHALVRRWALFTRLMKARRAQHAYSKRKRRERLADLFQRARDAATLGDKRTLHKLVRLLSPKQSYKPLRLRHADGRLMDLHEEVDAIQHQLTEQFAATPACHLVDSVQLSSIPFKCSDVVHALRTLSTYKAVPSGYVPTEFWKRYARPIGERIWKLLGALWVQSSVTIPECWSASWLCLIPKPLKNHASMSGWRPISLQDPCGKAVLSVVTGLATRQCEETLFRQPQFAYLRGRSTSDAIRRVATHVATSQHFYGLAHNTLYDMKAGRQKLSLGGGLQVFLDVEHAFDAVPRSLLSLALRRQPLDPSLIHLFLSWYSKTVYHYNHCGEKIAVQATTGVRQGCVAAPLLWNCHTCNVMNELQKSLGERWVQDVLTLFADDFHLQWTIEDERGFELACHQLSLFLQILDRLQVRVRAEKSSLMLLLGGKSVRNLVAKRMSRRQGQKVFLVRSPKEAQAHGQLCIPIVAVQKYLGVMISYRKMQSSTLAFRIRQSWGTFHKLRKWWQPASLPLLKRMELWKVIVWPTLSYGLSEVGLSHAGEQSLTTCVMKQLRILACSPVHITRESNTDLLDRLHWHHPVDLVVLSCCRQLLKRLDSLRDLHVDDILNHGWNKVRSIMSLHTSPHPQSLRRWLSRACNWVHRMQGLTHKNKALSALIVGCKVDALAANLRIDLLEAQAPTIVPPSLDTSSGELTCPECSRKFQHRMALRQHMRREHAITSTVGIAYDAARDMTEGMPQCRHCGWKFNKRQGLQAHIEMNACPVLAAQPSTQKSPALIHDDDLRCLLDRDCRYSELDSGYLKVLSSHCVLCHQWAPRAASLISHIRQKHGLPLLISGKHWALNEKSEGRAPSANPCSYCNAVFGPKSDPKRHLCPVLVQLGILVQQWQQLQSQQQPQRQQHSSEDGHDHRRGSKANASNVSGTRGHRRRRVCGKQPIQQAEEAECPSRISSREQSSIRLISEQKGEESRQSGSKLGTAHIQHGEVIDSSRRRHPNSQAEHGIHAVCADKQPSSPSSTQGEQALERRACQSHLSTATSAVSATHMSHARSASQGHASSATSSRWPRSCRLHQGSGRAATVSSQAHHRHSWQLHGKDVELVQERATSHSGVAISGRGLHHATEVSSSSNKPRDTPALSLDEAIGLSIHGHCAPVLPGSWLEARRCRHRLARSEPPSQAHHARTVRSPTQTHHLTAQSLGARHSAAVVNIESENLIDIHDQTPAAVVNIVSRDLIDTHDQSSADVVNIESKNLIGTHDKSHGSVTGDEQVAVPIDVPLDPHDCRHAVQTMHSERLDQYACGEHAAPMPYVNTGQYDRTHIPRFSNPGNACYQNALVVALLAVYIRSGITLGGISCLLCLDRCVELAQHSWFARLLEHWAEPERQHDIAEFAQHILPQLSTLVARWEGRIMMDSVIRSAYISMPSQPLLLPLPHCMSEPASLQALIRSWHDNAEGIWGLAASSPIVLLQLDRFQIRAGHVKKNFVPMTLPHDRVVRVPCFTGSNLHIVEQSYEIVAACLHLGLQIANGHYVCIWWQGTRIHLHDDSSASELDGLSRDHQQNMYLLLAVKCDDNERRP